MKKLVCSALLLSISVLAQKSRPVRAVVCAGAGTATAATCSPSPGLSALSELLTVPRVRVDFTPVANNTGVLTLAISGLTATPVRKYVGGAAQELAANDVRSGTAYWLDYDGAQFIVKSILGNGGTGGTGNEATATAAFTVPDRVVAVAAAGRDIKQTGVTVDPVTGELNTGASDFRVGGNPVAVSGVTASGSALLCVFDSGASNRLSCKNAAGTVFRYIAMNDVPDCANATTGKLLFNASTSTFSCGTDQSGTGGSAAYTYSWECGAIPSRQCTFKQANGSVAAVVAQTSFASELVGFQTDGTASEHSGFTIRLPITPATWTVRVQIYSLNTSQLQVTASRACIASDAALVAADNGVTASVTPTAASRYYTLAITMANGTCAANQLAHVVVSTNAVATFILSIDTVIQ